MVEPKPVREIERCRLCGSADLEYGMDLGIQWVVDFPEADGHGVKAPLEITRCGACRLPQLRHTVDRELLYREYFYRSSINGTMRAALDDVAEHTWSHRRTEQPVLLDIGANDGYLLRQFPPGIRRVAVEPARNIHPAGAERVIRDYFSEEAVAPHLPGGQADLVTSIAMFYDVDEPAEFIADVARILPLDGVWVNQMNYVPAVMDQLAFDFISHEHLTYWTLQVFSRAVALAGLEVFEAEVLPLNGGTIRTCVGWHSVRPVDPGVWELLNQERESGHNTAEAWSAFEFRVKANGVRLRRLLGELRSQGKRVFVRGASTRGTALLQAYGLTVEDLPYAADRDPNKWGRRMVGCDIPIVSEADARTMHPEYYLLLPYGYLDEIMGREPRDFYQRGGRFIVPLPEARIVEAPAWAMS